MEKYTENMFFSQQHQQHAQDILPSWQMRTVVSFRLMALKIIHSILARDTN